MDPEDLNVMWTCLVCDSRFIFRTDMNDHVRITGHSRIQKNDIISGKLIPVDA
jgi:hypothetical protein